MAILKSRELLEHLRFHYLESGVTPLRLPHETPWRFMPWTVIAQIVGGTVEVVLDDGRRLVLRDGDCLVAPDLRHRLTMTSAKAARSRWAHLDFTLFESINLLTLFDLPVIVGGDRARRLGDLCERMTKTVGDPKRDELTRAISLEHLGFEMLELLLELGKPRQDFALFFERAQRFAGVLGLVSREYGRALTLAEQGRLLLSSTDQTVGQISARIGYRDQFHFSRHFKRRFGVSPTAFRSAMHH